MNKVAITVFLVQFAAYFAEAFPYTLHATPIAFTEEPESMSVLQGTTVTLSCNTTILWNDNYKLPELIWRYNGQLLDGNHPSHFITTHPNNSRSELTIVGVSQENNGYYECVARDGYHLLEDGDASYFYIIASQAAQLKVIDVDLNVYEGVETVSVAVGQHLLLPCKTGAVNPPEQSTWMKDGIKVTGNENEVILGNGSLLILVAVEETEGSYQCTGYYNHEPLNSTTYNVSLSQASQGGSGTDPVIIIDGPAGAIEGGEWVNLTCYILNSEKLQVQWLKDGQMLSVTDKFLAMRASVQDSGTYNCQLISSAAVLATSDFNIIVANKPVVELSGCRELYPEQPCGYDAIRPKTYFERSITLTCSTSDPLASIHWYKNGQNFTMYSRDNTLRYRGGTSDDLLGIYQCFAVTPAGTSYDTVRVLRKGFTNAPGNFTCQAVDQTSNISLPSVILSWEQPTLHAYNVNSDGFAVPPQGGSYVIVYEANGVNNSRTVDAKNTTTLIDLPMDGHYTFWVYFDHNDEQFPITAISECKNDTFIRRTAVPRRLMVSCPESIPSDDHSDNITIPVKWISPVKSPNILGINIVLLRSVCLQSSTIQEDELLAGDFFKDDEVFNFEVGPLLPGAVCLFGGYYQLLDTYYRLFDILFVPSESCGIPAPQSTGEAQLKLTCSDSVANFEVVTAVGDAALNSTILTGLCISVNWEDRFTPLTEYYLAPGDSSISGLPDDTICTFYGSYQLQTTEVVDFEPVQCIMNHPLSLPPTTTEDITTNFAPTSTSAVHALDEVTIDTPEIIKSGTGTMSTLFQPDPGATFMSSDLGIYIGVPVVILLFLLVAAIVTIAILVFTIVTKTRELKESDANRKELAAYEQAHIYETISDPDIGYSNYDIVELQDVATDTYPQPLMTAELDKSTQKREQPHLQLDIVSCTNSSSTIHRQHDTPSRSRVNTSQCLQAESYHDEKINQYENISSTDVNQIKATENLEQNTHSHDLQVGHYEMTDHYEKRPHCDLSPIASVQKVPIVRDEHYHNEENGQNVDTPCSDVNQIEMVSEDLEQDTDLRVEQYESQMINRYEKAPHCDLSLIIFTQRIPIIHDERHCNEENGQDVKTPCSDAKQIETVSEDLEQDTRSHDLQVGHYEMINHYEKVPHCDLSLITSTQRTPIIHDERYYDEDNGQDAKTSRSDAKQIETASEDLKQNTHSHDLQVDKRGHCQYESISHYEKIPHCDLALISSAQRKPVYDEKLPSPTCYLTETGKM